MRREITHAVEIARHFGPAAAAAYSKLATEGLVLAATVWLIGFGGGAFVLFREIAR